jgi:hypothetical protein
MKKLITYIILVLSVATNSYAQRYYFRHEPQTLEESLSQKGYNYGTVTIKADQRLNNLLYYRKTQAEEQKIENLTCKGFRIRMYSGNSPKVSKTEALEIENLIKEDFPEIPTYLDFVAPFWKLHIGNYSNYQEATKMCNILKEKYPRLRNTIFVVKEDEVIIL